MNPICNCRSLTFALSCAVVGIVLALSGCDGQANKPKAPAAAKAPVANGQVLHKAAITSVKFSAPVPEGPVAAVVLPNGDTIEYFEQSQTVLANQALVRSAGRSYWVYYDGIGHLSRVVDASNGNYLVVRLRPDTLGAEYLSFNILNQFIEGSALFKDPSRWFLAPVLGQMPQLTFSMSAKAIPQTQAPALTASMSLVSTQLAYGSVVVMPPVAQTVLNGEDAMSFLDRGLHRAVDMIVPSAFASDVATDYSPLSDGLNLAVIGASAFAPNSSASLLFAAASAASIYRRAAGLPSLSLNKIYLKRDQMLEYAVSGSYADVDAGAVGLLERVRNGAAVVLSRGIGRIATAVPRAVIDAPEMPAGMRPNFRLADATPAQYELPQKLLRSTQLTGSGVDNQGRIFKATGDVSQDDVVNIVAKGPDGEMFTIKGKLVMSKFVGVSFERTVIPTKK